MMMMTPIHVHVHAHGIHSFNRKVVIFSVIITKQTEITKVQYLDKIEQQKQ